MKKLLNQGIEDEFEKSPVLKIQAVETPIPPPLSETILADTKSQQQNILDLAVADALTSKTVYYITDVHLEHQLKPIVKNGVTGLDEIKRFLDEKLREMIPIEHTGNDILLVGGDVADNIELTTLFYQKLTSFWKGKIISILGNHELWDFNPNSTPEGDISKPIEEIINNYRTQINILRPFWLRRGVLLQNSIYIKYKNCEDRIYEESQILHTSKQKLKNILSDSTLIVLGGIGFSGLNPHYNAELGLYRSAVTTREEDMELSKRFYSVYRKINLCAGDKQVIVLTHTPVENWTREAYNPNWIYINGHTHRNSLIREKGGTTVLSDNQVGYKPSKWRLKGFTVSGWYDPFRNKEDGIYKITLKEYEEFNNGRGIQSESRNITGQIYALKRSGLYMFLLISSSQLYLLNGGIKQKIKRDERKQRINRGINYYYENMELYGNKVKDFYSPYRQKLEMISKEIKKFGGSGKVHGCIVDISYFCHVYLNPFDGKITPYFAKDISSRLVYDSIPSLLNNHEPELCDNFLNAHNDGLIPLLSQYAVTNKEVDLETDPELDLGTEIYKPSKKMKSLQYILESNTIRIWEDEILTADFSKLSSNLMIEEKPKQIT